MASVARPPRRPLALAPSFTNRRPPKTQTLAFFFSFPSSIAAAIPSSAAAVDSSPPVSHSPIPRVPTFLSLPSADFAPHPTFSPSLQGRRRAPPPAAARRHRATPSSPLLAVRLWGEPLRPLGHAVLAPPAPLRPRLVALLAPAAAAAAATAVAACDARALWPRPRRGQGPALP